jgi:hypothetical protein
MRGPKLDDNEDTLKSLPCMIEDCQKSLALVGIAKEIRAP